MARVLSDLHAIDPGKIGLADFGWPGSYFERQIKRWTEQYRSNETGTRPAPEFLMVWLPRNMPPNDGQVAITHGDYRLDNLVFGRDGSGAA